MEQQYGQRGIMDDRFHKQQRSSSSPLSRGNDLLAPRNGSGADRTPTAGAQLDRRNSSGGAGSSGASQSASDVSESLQETVAHQKYEIVRLLNTVKTLSSENTKLLKVSNELCTFIAVHEHAEL